MTADRCGPRRVRRGRGRVLRILLAGVVASSMAVVAQAYVSMSGTGAGTATTGTVGAIKLLPASVTDPLFPGQTAAVALTAQNTDATEVRIQTLVVDTSQGTSGFGRASGSASCGLTAFTFTTQNNGGEGWILPGNSSLDISLPDAVSASTSTASACQGAVLTVYLKAT